MSDEPDKSGPEYSGPSWNRKLKKPRGQKRGKGGASPQGPFRATEEVLDKICGVLREGGSLHAASRASGVSYATICLWRARGRVAVEQDRQDDPYRVIFERMEEAQQECVSVLDKIEWNVATAEEAPHGARLKAVEMVRNRIDRREPRVSRVEVALSGAVTTTVEAAEPLTDRQLRTMSDTDIARLVSVVAEITGESAEPRAEA